MRLISAVILLLLAVAFALAAVFTLHNLVNIVMYRSETISVVNALIGQGVLIIALMAMATLMCRSGLKRLK